MYFTLIAYVQFFQQNRIKPHKKVLHLKSDRCNVSATPHIFSRYILSVRLIDPSKPFRVVYSLFEVAPLGCLISAHIVPEMGDGMLSLEHQGLHPENYSQFSPTADATDKLLVQKLADINLKAIIKRFNGNPKDPSEFFESRYQGQVRELVNQFVQRRMAEVLPLLKDRHIYLMGNDGYPAGRPVEFVQEKASILFHFRRHPEETHLSLIHI